MSLVMLCPSRGRPSAAAELAELWPQVTDSARLVLAVDEDDPCRAEYERLPVQVQVVSSGLGVGAILNTLGPQWVAGRQHDCVGFLGDDHRPRTSGWDTLLTQALETPGVAYGNDLHQRGALPTACIISADIISALGYMCPPGVRHLYLDDFWRELGGATMLAYLPGVVIEHCHPHAGKGQWDEGYARVNSPERYAADSAAYRVFLAERWPADLERLRKALV